jgi:adenylate cyclase
MMNDRLFGELLPSTIVGALCAGLGVLFFLTDRRSRSTRALALAFVALGLSVLSVPYLVDHVGSEPTLSTRLHAIFEPVYCVTVALYAWTLSETSRAGALARRQVRLVLSLGLGVTAALLALGLAFPKQRLNDFLYSLGSSHAFATPGFWLFAGPWVVLTSLFVGAYGLIWRYGIDEAERIRAVSLVLAGPLLLGSLVAPYEGSVWLVLAGVLLTLWGVFRYHVAAGERSAFLSRFLAPEVSLLVQSRGLAEVMKPHEVELTVVCCDLRGFTAYAEAIPSQAVIDLLAEYYDAVGEAVAEFNGTIKDYAGDGMLVLVGAPVPREDHASVGLALAPRLLAVTRPILERWSTELHPLGLGAGVASGRVTVGAIGSSNRMEYTAVGIAVNLAARLCSQALDGEILVSHRTVELAEYDKVIPRGSIQVKGLRSEQEIFAIQS